MDYLFGHFLVNLGNSGLRFEGVHRSIFNDKATPTFYPRIGFDSKRGPRQVFGYYGISRLIISIIQLIDGIAVINGRIHVFVS